MVSQGVYVLACEISHLVDGLEHDFLLFHTVGSVIIPIDELIFSRDFLNRQQDNDPYI